ncbi:hypothetical protein A20C1_00300 [marine actinobacterium PHSC20C1]|nr:hypothetical protein A20C1_00300 [marine actinobacterium PHSC20C1]
MRQAPTLIAVLGPAVRQADGVYAGIPAVVKAIAPNVVPLTAELNDLAKLNRSAALCEAVRDLTRGDRRLLGELSTAARKSDGDFLAELVRVKLLSLLVLQRAGRG